MSLGVGRDPFAAHCTFCDGLAKGATADGKLACFDCLEDRRGEDGE